MWQSQVENEHWCNYGIICMLLLHVVSLLLWYHCCCCYCCCCSLEKAISFASTSGVDGFLAVGGGSVMDTAKAANLYSCHPEKDLMDFVNAPIGKGEVPTKTLKPLVCGELSSSGPYATTSAICSLLVPTTSGTGSETTGVCVFDHKGLDFQAKIGTKIGIVQ